MISEQYNREVSLFAYFVDALVRNYEVGKPLRLFSTFPEYDAKLTSPIKDSFQLLRQGVKATCSADQSPGSIDSLVSYLGTTKRSEAPFALRTVQWAVANRNCLPRRKAVL